MGRLQATCGARRSAVPCKQLRAFTSVFERARSRLVAFSRANFCFVFGHVRARLGVFFRHFSSFFVILRPKMAFSGMTGNGLLRQRLGREGSSLLRVAPPRRGQDGQNGMAFIGNRYAVAAGPRLRSFVLRTSVLQKRGVCSCWEFQGVSQNGGGVLSCSEGQDSQQLSELWFRQSVCWRQLTAAAQAASSLTRIRRVAVRFWRPATCICHPL